jgi:hypothetical protein
MFAVDRWHGATVAPYTRTSSKMDHGDYISDMADQF